MSGSGSGAPIDVAVLERVAERAESHPLVARVERKRTDGVVATLVLRLGADRYPTTVERARLDCRWFENDDYSLHYVETRRDGSTWQCRWDRHPNPHAERAHFHRPPDAAAVVDDPEAPPHPMDVFSRTLANVRDRIDRVWDETPSE